MSLKDAPLSNLLMDLQPGFASGKEDPDGVLQIRMNNVRTDGTWDWTKTRKVPATQKQLEKYTVREGDILFNATNSPEQVGKTALVSRIEEPTAFSNHFLRLRTDPDRVDPAYVSRYMNVLWGRDVFRHMVDSWVNQATVQRDSLLNIRVPTPPLLEQKRIVAILDKADAIRRKRQQAIELADEFLRSVFLDLFGDPVTNPKGWGHKPLHNIAEVRSGVTKGKRYSGKTLEVPYLRVANVQDGYLDLSEVKSIEVSEADRQKYQLASGDILLTEGGDPDKLGRGYIWRNEVDGCIHQNHIFSVRLSSGEHVLPEYLSALVGSARGKRYFLKVGKQTTGIATINKTVLSDFPVLIPPVELQEKYAQICKQILQLKHAHQKTDLGLFESLSQQAFSGKLDVKGD